MPSDEGRYEPPKRNRTAYNLFYQSARKRILEAIPDPPTPRISKGRKTHGKISFQGLARRIADMWKALPDEEKLVFEETARRDKERYLKEKKKWRESIAELERQHSSEALDYSMLGLSENESQGMQEKTESRGKQTTPTIHQDQSLPSRINLVNLKRPVANSFAQLRQPMKLPKVDSGKHHEAAHVLQFSSTPVSMKRCRRCNSSKHPSWSRTVHRLRRRTRTTPLWMLL